MIFLEKWQKKIVLNFGIHGCIVLYPICVVTIHAITVNYCTVLL